MAEVCKLFGIEKLRTTPYKPSTTQVKRFHKTMNGILAKTVADHHKDWNVRLPYAMTAYRAARHKATEYSTKSSYSSAGSLHGTSYIRSILVK